MTTILKIEDLLKSTNLLVNLYKKLVYKGRRRIIYVNEAVKEVVINFIKSNTHDTVIDMDCDLVKLFPCLSDLNATQNKDEFMRLIRKKYKDSMFLLFSGLSPHLIYVSSNHTLIKDMFKLKRIQWFVASSVFRTNNTISKEEPTLIGVKPKKVIEYNDATGLLVAIKKFIE